MRRLVSDNKRKVIISLAVVIAVIIVLVLVVKLSSYTKTLHEDISRASVLCTDITVISDGDFSPLTSRDDFMSLFPDGDISHLSLDNNEICIVDIEYIFFSNITEEIKDLSVKVSPMETATGSIYAHTDVSFVSCEENAYKYVQTLVADRSDVRDVYFTENLPRNFKAPYHYEISYKVSGEEELKTVGFTTSEKQ